MLQFLLRLSSILLFTFFNPVTARSPCADKENPAPIAINLGIDAITAVCAESQTKTSTIASVLVWGDDHNTTIYGKAMMRMRWEYFRQNTAHLNKPASGLLSKLRNLITYTCTTVSGIILYSVELAITLLADLEIDILNRYILMPILLGVVQLVEPFSSLSLRAETDVSEEDLKAAFLQAFQVLKSVSLKESGVDITSSLVLYPTFLDNLASHVISDAAHEAGFFAYQMWTPHQMINFHSLILDESPQSEPLKRGWETSPTLIIDYGLSYLDIQTTYRKNKFTPDMMGGQYIVQHMMRSIVSSGQDIPEELAENGPAQEKMFWAVANARLRMKEQVAYETWETPENGPQIREWPVTVKDWEDGEHVAVISWDYVKDAEAAYVEWLREFLILLIERLEASHSETIGKVIILGNVQDRSLVTRAVRKSCGAQVRIIGGNDERDITLEAQGGARIAWSAYERAQRAEEATNEDYLVQEDL